MFGYFARVMRASDFQSFQAMSSTSNPSDIVAMTRILGRYGPVMLAHYQPGDDSAKTLARDMHIILTRDYLARITADGLFAMSFMQDTPLRNSSATFQFVKKAIATYGR